MSSPIVLIVEDEQPLALQLEKQLIALGCDILAIACSYSEALAQASVRLPDIALVNIRIAGPREGVKTAVLLRRKYGVPVIYLVANEDEEIFARATDSEPYGFLVKPINPAELQRALEFRLQRSMYEQQIRQREAWLASTLGSLKDGVVTFDPDGETLFINPAAQELAAAARSPIFEMAVVGKPQEMVFEDTTGRTRTAIRTRSIVRDEFSELGTVLVLRDITEQVEAAKELAKSTRLASLGQMVNTVAHEMSNPLTVILGNSTFVHETLEEADEAHPIFQEVFTGLRELGIEIQDAAERIRVIVSDMMSLSQPGLVVATPSVAETIAAAVRTTRFSVEDRAMVLTKLQPNLPSVALDSGKLSQVIGNLIVNAAQAMKPDGHPQNTIQITASFDGDQVQISVSDNGVGMSEQTLSRAFEPFFTTKKAGRGPGLGLSICYGVIDAAGGTLAVETQENVGTTFTISLPLKAKTPAEHDSTAKMRVLLVEDDVINRRLLTRILSAYDVVPCSNTREAIEKIQTGERFDAIILDLEMGGTGLDFYDGVNAIDPDQGASVIFVSAGLIEASTEERLRVLPNFCLQKPFDIRNLREVLSITVQQR